MSLAIGLGTISIKAWLAAKSKLVSILKNEKKTIFLNQIDIYYTGSKFFLYLALHLTTTLKTTIITLFNSLKSHAKNSTL